MSGWRLDSLADRKYQAETYLFVLVLAKQITPKDTL